MASDISITNNVQLTINSDNPTVEMARTATGARVFRINKPCQIIPALAANQVNFPGGIVNINGINHSGNNANPAQNNILVIEQPNYVEIQVS